MGVRVLARLRGFGELGLLFLCGPHVNNQINKCILIYEYIYINLYIYIHVYMYILYIYIYMLWATQPN